MEALAVGEDDVGEAVGRGVAADRGEGPGIGVGDTIGLADDVAVAGGVDPGPSQGVRIRSGRAPFGVRMGGGRGDHRHDDGCERRDRDGGGRFPSLHVSNPLDQLR